MEKTSLNVEVHQILLGLLKIHPNAKAVDLIAHIEEKHGLAVSEPTISCAHRDSGLAPDFQQFRAAKAKRKNTDLAR